MHIVSREDMHLAVLGISYMDQHDYQPQKQYFSFHSALKDINLSAKIRNNCELETIIWHFLAIFAANSSKS